jgi:hypothetical protein
MEPVSHDMADTSSFHSDQSPELWAMAMGEQSKAGNSAAFLKNDFIFFLEFERAIFPSSPKISGEGD